MLGRQLQIGDPVNIKTLWADKEFPNVPGRVIGLRHGGAVAIIETVPGKPLRTIHVSFLA